VQARLASPRHCEAPGVALQLRTAMNIVGGAMIGKTIDPIAVGEGQPSAIACASGPNAPNAATD